MDFLNDSNDDIADIFEAVNKGDELKVKFLIDGKCDPNEKHNGITPLHLAVQNSREDMVKMLLENGATPTVTDGSGNTPLHLAILDKRLYITKILIEHTNWDINTQNEQGQSLMQLVTEKSGRYSNWIEIKELLESRAIKKVPDLLTGTSMDITLEYHRRLNKNKRRHLDDNESNSKKAKTDPTYASSGLKFSLHGTIYQLQLIMLFLHKARKYNYVDFYLATEWNDAEKFDDVVIKYKKSPSDSVWTWKFLQAKHKQDVAKSKITVNDLTKKSTKDEFLIQKYFLSFCKIKSNPEFEGAKLAEFELCTNADFDFGKKTGRNSEELNKAANEWKNYFSRTPIRNDDLLHFEDDVKTVKNKFVPNKKCDLLKFMRRKFFEETITSNAIGDFPAIKSYLIYLNAKPKIEETINDVNTKLNDAPKKLTKLYLTSLSNKICKLKGDILEDKKYEQIKKLIEEKRLNQQLLENIKQELIKICEEISEALQNQDNEYKTVNSPTSNFSEECKRLGEFQEKVKHYSEKISTLLSVDGIKSEIMNSAGLASLFTEEMLKKLDKTDLDEAKEKVIAKLNTYINNKVQVNLLLNDRQFDERIDEFIEAFCLITNYPNVDRLNDYLSKELGAEFKLLNADLVTNSFQKDVLDWFKEYNKGRSEFLSLDKGDSFFHSINEKIHTLMVSGLSKAYPEKLKTYGMRFKEAMELLNEFLESKEKLVLQLCTDATMLASINVLQTIESQKKYEAHDSYLFINIRTNLSENIQKILVESFSSVKSHHLLVIECQIKSDVDRGIFEKIKRALDRSFAVPKKVIIITDESNLLNDTFQNSEYYQTRTIDINFKMLNEASQNRILERKCRFQNKTVALKELMNRKTGLEIVDQFTLTRIVEDEIICIGNDEAFLFNDYVQDYYIERNLHRQKIKASVLREADRALLFVTGIDDNRLVRMGADENSIHQFVDDKKYSKGIVWSRDRKIISLKFQNAPSKLNVHWLDCKDENLFWFKSKGDFRHIFEHVDTEYICTDNHFDENYFSIPNSVDEKIVVIANDSGVGKSTFLTGLSRKMIALSDSLWIIRINLNDFAFNKDKLPVRDSRHRINSLREISFEDHEVARAIEYFAGMVIPEDSKVDNTFQKRLLKFSLRVTEKGYLVPRIVLMFDGFDEVSPTYTQNTLTLLRALVETNIAQIYVTTRLHEKEELESALQCTAFVLKPLDHNEQIAFLNKFWKYCMKFFKEKDNVKLYEKLRKYLNDVKTALDENEIGELIDDISVEPTPVNDLLRGYVDRVNLSNFAEQLLRQWNDKINDDNTFNIVPLHLRMLAEIVFYDKFKITEQFDLLNLYDRFVEIKYNVYYDEKKNLGNTVGAVDIRERDSSQLRKDFQMISLQVLFPDHHRNEFDKKKKKQLARIGFLVLKGTRLDFVHRSFTGYFLSEFVVYDFSREETQTLLFQTILWENVYNFVRKFFNNQLERTSLEDVELLENAAEKVYILDGRDSILNIAANEGHTTTAAFIIDKFLKYPLKLREMLLITGNYGAVFHELVHSPFRNRGNNPNMFKALLKKVSGHYDILEHIFNKSTETDGLIIMGTQTSFTLLEKTIACRNLELFQTLIDSVADNPEALRKMLLTSKIGLISCAVCWFSKFSNEQLFLPLLDILYKSVREKSLFEKLLVEHDDKNNTVLHFLAKQSSNPLSPSLLNWLKKVEDKYPGIVEVLLEAKNNNNLTALEVAVYNNSAIVINLLELIRNTSSRLFRDLLSACDKKNIIYKAVVQNKLNSSEILLNWFYENVDGENMKEALFATAQDGRTCLHLAAARGFVDTVKCILHFLERVNNTPFFGNILNDMLFTISIDGSTSLTEALYWERYDVVALFFEFMDNNMEDATVIELLTKRNKYKRTCVHESAAKECSRTLQLLLSYILNKFGRDRLAELILAGDNYGNSALHVRNTCLLDFIYEHMNTSTLKRMILKANDGGFSLLDIAMYNKGDILKNVKPKIEIILNEIANPTDNDIAFTKAELIKLKTFTENTGVQNKDNILKTIDENLANMPEDTTFNNNQPSTSSLLCLPE